MCIIDLDGVLFEIASGLELAPIQFYAIARWAQLEFLLK